MSGEPTEPETKREATIAPEILVAAKEVDRGLIAWALSLSPRERLRAATRARRALARFKRVASP